MNIFNLPYNKTGGEKMQKGIDVSAANGIVNWESVKKSGREFAIIRCGYGNDIVSQDDKQYKNNIRKCEELNIPYGIYLYSYALNLNDALSEVNHVLRLLKEVGKNFKYGVWFDMEDADGYKRKNGMPSNKMLVDICYTFCEKVESKGYYTGIYASLSWLNNQLNSSKLNRFDKWVAQWGDKCTYKKPYSIWQNSNNLIIDGKRFDSDILVKDNFSDDDREEKKWEVKYQVWDGVKRRWLPNVINDSDYAGIFGDDICLVYASANIGNLYYKVHVKGGSWLKEVKNRTDYAGLKNKVIDAFMIKSNKKKIMYRVHLRKSKKWLPWVTGYNTKDSKNGYAGIIGQEIDAIQIKESK